MKNVYILFGLVITLFLVFIIKELEKGNITITKIFYKKSQLIKFKKEKGE